MSNKNSNDNLQSLADINKTIHEPARLLILSHLLVVESSDFLFLMNQTQLTRGNLSSHLSKLEAAGYVKIKKEFVQKIPRTLLSITAKGKTALKQYQQNMKQILENIS